VCCWCQQAGLLVSLHLPPSNALLTEPHFVVGISGRQGKEVVKNCAF
jgi:hypothetical protein